MPLLEYRQVAHVIIIFVHNLLNISKYKIGIIMRVKSVAAIAPNIIAIAIPWNIGSKNIINDPTTTANAVRIIGLSFTMPALITASSRF